MKSVVLIKQVQEAPSIQGDAGGAGSVVEDSQNVTNPYDLFAIEEGLQNREKHNGEVSALTLGGDSAVEVLREALAMGVNQAIHVKDAAFDGVDAGAAAKVLAAAVKKVGDVDVVFVGKQSIDTNTSVTGPMVARHLGMTLLTEVFKVEELDLEGRTITVQRLMEGGLQKVKAKLPALIAVTKDINEPRYASLLGIRKAAKAPITEWSAADLGGAPESHSKITARQVPAARPAGEILQGEAEELADALVAKLVDGKSI
ncbi:MAG: electron transfer flavoprotein subunit beta [Gemmatimonadota bacterium]|nr:MAG: electron transfer flavoprotein subunit beta [Gemmatimonadota bacterium]